MAPDLMLDNLESITNDLNDTINTVQDTEILLEESLALTNARIQLMLAFATLELAIQQRAANLLALATTRSSEVASTMDLNAARKLITTQELG